MEPLDAPCQWKIFPHSSWEEGVRVNDAADLINKFGYVCFIDSDQQPLEVGREINPPSLILHYSDKHATKSYKLTRKIIARSLLNVGCDIDSSDGSQSFKCFKLAARQELTPPNGMTQFELRISDDRNGIQGDMLAGTLILSEDASDEQENDSMVCDEQEPLSNAQDNGGDGGVGMRAEDLVNRLNEVRMEINNCVARTETFK